MKRLCLLALCAASLAVLPAALAAEASNDVFTSFQTVKLAEGAYAFIAPETPSAVVTGNTTLLVGSNAALVVDSGHFPSLTKKLVAEIRRLTDKPVRYLVMTHWHPDHNAGNGVFLDAFPGLAIVSTEYTRGQFDTKVKQNSTPKGNEETIKFIDDLLAKGVFLDGAPLTDVQLRYLKLMRVEFVRMQPEVEQARHVRPNLAFEKSLTVDLGGKLVKIQFLGRGNTAGDAVTYVPGDKLLIAGDLLVYPCPYGIGSFFTDWIATLRELAAFDTVAIVPGHGRVMYDKSYITRLSALLESIMEQTREAVRAGKTLKETRDSLKLDDFLATLPADDPTWKLAFEEGFLSPGLPRAYREVKEGKLDTD